MPEHGVCPVEQAKAEARTDSRPCGEMPKYKCHKVVHALKINGMNIPARAGAVDTDDRELVFEENDYAPMFMAGEWMRKHNPQVGGYYVVYDDGYQSYSPGDAFEKGYTRIN